MIKLTKAQREALYKVWLRSDSSTDYRAFRRTVQPGPGCVMIHWRSMWLGIEPDGYTHS